MSKRICASCDCRLTAFETNVCRRCEHEDQYWADYGDDDFPMTPEEEDAAEQAYLNSQARAEWDHYHPGEPCPAIELPYPPKGAASGEIPSELPNETQAPVAFEQSKS